MNREAERHLDKAEGYLGKGDGWYAKAADEIIAALAADPSLSQTAIGKRFGKSQTWVSNLVAWRTSDAPEHSPIDHRRGSHGTRAEQEAVLDRFLQDAPAELVERKLGNLPQDRQQVFAAAAGDRYAQARQDYDERERNLTPVERKEREAAGQTIHEHVGRMTAGFDALSIANNLGEATERLKEMISNNTITTDGLNHIDLALAEFLDEYRVAQAMVGVEVSE